MRSFDYASAATVEEAIQIADGQHASREGTPRFDGTPPPSTPSPVRQGARTDGHDGAGNGTSGYVAAALAGHGAPRFLAGGTDLLTLMKADVTMPSLLIDVKRADDLPRGIEQHPDRLVIGALTTLSEIERHPAIVERYPVLAQAIGEAATPQLRNMATIGGNLLQRPRCWYFRNHLFNCWLKGGSECQAQEGENQYHALFGGRSAASPCVAVHPSDAASALLALDAQAQLRGPGGERTVPIEDLFAEPTTERRTETIVHPNELLVELRMPVPAPDSRSIYLKAMDRKVWAFALVGVAAVARVERGRIAEARLVLTGVAPIPWRARPAEQVLGGQAPGPELFARAADAALADARPLEQNGYKIPLARSLIARALAAITA